MNSNLKEDLSTSAKVIIFTSHGQLQVQLWAKEAPITCKNFIQLALNGYYNNTIFHKIIPGFMIQGGDATGTGQGGQSIYNNNKPFSDQFHQRLKFDKRGILASANSGKNMNNSQFFITFAQCQHLNKKYTIFGKVVGDTIYNLLSMQSIDTDPQTSRPLDPPIIRKIKVVVNPFQDIQLEHQLQVKQNLKSLIQPQVLKKVVQKNQTKKQLKKLKNKNKLTFQDEQQQQLNQKSNLILSAHDAIVDQKFSKKQIIETVKIEEKKQLNPLKKYLNLNSSQLQNKNSSIENNLNKQQAKSKKQNITQNQISIPIDDNILNYQKKVNPKTGKMQIYWDNKNLNVQSFQKTQKKEDIRQLQLKQYDSLKANELNFKAVQQGSLKQRRKKIISQQKDLLSNAEKKRYQYLLKKRNQQNELQILQKLNMFTNKLVKKDNSWMSHKLKFHIDSQNAYKITSQNKDMKQFQRNAQLQDDDFYKNIDEKKVNLEQLYQMTKFDKN